MHSLSVVLNLLLASVAVATPQGAEIFRRASCGSGQQSALSCINAAGPTSASAFCASYIPTKSTTISFKETTTSTIYSTSTRGDVVTVKASTSTSTSTVDQNGLALTTTTDATSYTATVVTTTTVASTTSTLTSTSTSFTCAAAVTPAPQVKRQAAATCTSSYNSGTISGACNNCGGGFPTRTATMSTTSTSTKYTTSVMKVTKYATTTPVTVTTTTASSTSTTTIEATALAISTSTFATTATFYTTTTSVTMVPSPTPTQFNLYYVDAAGATHTALERDSPGGSGKMVGFTTAATGSIYSLNANNLIDGTTGATLGINTVDEYPFLFDGVAGQTAPVCNACGGLVTCTSQAGGTQFAVCDGFLALGTVFGPDGNGNNDCTTITLMFDATPA